MEGADPQADGLRAAPLRGGSVPATAACALPPDGGPVAVCVAVRGHAAASTSARGSRPILSFSLNFTRTSGATCCVAYTIANPDGSQLFAKTNGVPGTAVFVDPLSLGQT